MAIHINNLLKGYSDTIVLDIPEMYINSGEIVGLVGNNGAGKTTFIRLMLDLIKADRGEVRILDERVVESENWKLYTSAYIDSSFLIDFLTPEEYFEFICQCYNVNKNECTQLLEDLLPLSNGELTGKRKYIRDFSSGNRQKIGIIGAILSKPKVLFLDEPFNFLDPSSQYFLQDYIKLLNKLENTTIILSSHNIDQIANVATRIVVLEKGRIIQDIKDVSEDSKNQLKNYFHKNAHFNG